MPKDKVIPAMEEFSHRRRALDEYKALHDRAASKDATISSSRFYEAERHVFHQGEEATHLFEVVSGVLMISKMTEDGRRNVVEIIPKGWICGFSVGQYYDASCEALTNTTVNAYRRVDLDKADTFGNRQRLFAQVECQICA